MDDFCEEINSKPLKEPVTATAPWKKKILIKRMDSTVPGIKHSYLQKEKCF